jgi:predicted nucleotidyltransferase
VLESVDEVKEILMKLEETKKDLKELSKYEAVIFGSYAIGEFGEDSDIDIFCYNHKEKIKTQTSPSKRA